MIGLPWKLVACIVLGVFFAAGTVFRALAGEREDATFSAILSAGFAFYAWLLHAQWKRDRDEGDR